MFLIPVWMFCPRMLRVQRHPPHPPDFQVFANLGDGGTVFAFDSRRERYAGYNEDSAEGAECLAGSFAGYVDNVALQLAGSGPLHLDNDSAGDDDLLDSVVTSVAETGELDQHDHSGAKTAHENVVI